jgi:hypothetical protein
VCKFNETKNARENKRSNRKKRQNIEKAWCARATTYAAVLTDAKPSLRRGATMGQRRLAVVLLLLLVLLLMSRLRWQRSVRQRVATPRARLCVLARARPCRLL